MKLLVLLVLCSALAQGCCGSRYLPELFRSAFVIRRPKLQVCLCCGNHCRVERVGTTLDIFNTAAGTLVCRGQAVVARRVSTGGSEYQIRCHGAAGQRY